MTPLGRSDEKPLTPIKRGQGLFAVPYALPGTRCSVRRRNSSMSRSIIPRDFSQKSFEVVSMFIVAATSLAGMRVVLFSSWLYAAWKFVWPSRYCA